MATKATDTRIARAKEQAVRRAIHAAYPWLNESDVEPVLRLLRTLNAKATGDSG